MTEKRVTFIPLGDLRVNVESIAAVRFESKVALVLMNGDNFSDQFGPIKITKPEEIETLKRAIDFYTMKQGKH